MKKSIIVQLYLAVVAAVSLIVVAINFSILISRTLDYFFVSWEEYKILHKWEIDTPCEKVVTPLGSGNVATPPKVDEECKKQNEENLKLKRQLEFKQTLINSLPVSLIFLIIFLVHYRALKAYMNNCKDIEVEK